jgi:hypothetical protein
MDSYDHFSASVSIVGATEMPMLCGANVHSTMSNLVLAIAECDGICQEMGSAAVGSKISTWSYTHIVEIIGPVNTI